MVPSVITEQVMAHRIEMIAITDHNTGGNVEAFDRALKNRDITLLYGMEISTKEDVHVLLYFSDIITLKAFEKEVVRPALRNVEVDPEIYGYQLYVDERDNFTGMEESWLGQSLLLSLYQAVSAGRKFGALVVLSHIYRRFGLVYQLGFLPDDLPVSGVEVLSPEEEEEVRRIRNLTVIASSDAHHPEQIGRRKSLLRAYSRSFSELELAFAGEEGRSVSPLWD
ncbi:MAG TPA: phosphotransferase [Thermotogae bacterium]|nr:phosphotransferase [Thermotogota bacterium]